MATATKSSASTNGRKAGSTSGRAKAKPTAETIQKSYINYLLEEGEQPKTIYAFAKILGMEEAEFYNFYSSFEAIERGVWDGYMQRTLDALKNDTAFEDFSVREKLLAFFYTHLEILREQRSYVAMRLPELRKPQSTPYWLKGYRKNFEAFAQELISEGIYKKEIKERPMLTDRYRAAMWLQLLFVLDFWAKDKSAGFEQTDAAIEKAVNFGFQLLGESALDSAIDLAKFLWQSR